MKTDTAELVKQFRNKIEEEYEHITTEMNEFIESRIFNDIDKFLEKKDKSDLEKMFYLFLNQYPDDSKNYLVIPSEKVLIQDFYDMSTPAIEYEIDFAIYGGKIEKPVKIAIECDGVRSHRQKHKHKDRRKNINLQASGWIIIRFGAKELIREVQNYIDDKLDRKDFLFSIENLIKNTIKLVDYNSYLYDYELKERLTGFKYGNVICKLCKKQTKVILNYKKVRCEKCHEKFERDILKHEQIEYEYNGLITFKK